MNDYDCLHCFEWGFTTCQCHKGPHSIEKEVVHAGNNCYLPCKLHPGQDCESMREWVKFKPDTLKVH
jgi:hypothetical protein